MYLGALYWEGLEEILSRRSVGYLRDHINVYQAAPKNVFYTKHIAHNCRFCKGHGARYSTHILRMPEHILKKEYMFLGAWDQIAIASFQLQVPVSVTV